jgi:hypothetical protein
MAHAACVGKDRNDPMVFSINTHRCGAIVPCSTLVSHSTYIATALQGVCAWASIVCAVVFAGVC